MGMFTIKIFCRMLSGKTGVKLLKLFQIMHLSETQKLLCVDVKILMNNLYQFSGRMLLHNTEEKQNKYWE